VHYTLTLFCIIRVVAFAMRAVLAGSESTAENLSVVIADEALFGIGYFGLIYSAYNLVLDRILLADPTPPENPILRITQNRRLFRLAILVALILGIASSTSTNSDGSTSSTTSTLHIASTVLFLVVTVLQAVQTIFLASKRVSGQNKYYKQGTLGVKYGNYILLVISLLLVIRESFATATVSNTAKQNNEHFWYPFLAVPEFFVVILFSTPGLVPRQDEVPEYSLADTTPLHARTAPYNATAPYATNQQYETNPQFATSGPYSSNSSYATPLYAASHVAPIRYGA